MFLVESVIVMQIAQTHAVLMQHHHHHVSLIAGFTWSAAARYHFSSWLSRFIVVQVWLQWSLSISWPLLGIDNYF